MLGWTETIGPRNLLLAVAALVLAASLATAAIVEAARFSPLSPERGYLLYPRSGVCASARGASNAATGTGGIRRSASVLRTVRSANATMPPELGQRLDAKWLESVDHGR